MLGYFRLGAFLLCAAACASGCFRFDFGDPEIKGCGTDPEDIADAFQDRYALGSNISVSTTGLVDPIIESSDERVVRIEHDRTAELAHVFFVGEGRASIRVSEGEVEVERTLTVARLARFEVLLPGRRPIELEGRALVYPEFFVAYFDAAERRLHGRGLAESEWPRMEEGNLDAFYNDWLPPGPSEVEVRVGRQSERIQFEVVHPADVASLWILETQLDDGRIQVDLVGLSLKASPVWNLDPIFQLPDAYFVGSFVYTYDPDATPTPIVAQSLSLSLDPVEKEIYSAEHLQQTFAYGSAGVPGGRAPLVALLSLLLIALVQRFGVMSTRMNR
jgi:hypothetical protein